MNREWNNDCFHPIETEKIDCFKKELETVSGVCLVCKTKEEAKEKIKAILQENQISELFCSEERLISQLNGLPITTDKKRFLSMETGITSCEFLVARTGSVVLSSAQGGRQMNIYPPIHIVLARKSQIVDYVSDAISEIQKKYGDDLPSCISFVSGPSRTADIEKTLVLGAHGPKSLYVVIIEKWKK